jgi:hypothetical protein
METRVARAIRLACAVPLASTACAATLAR